jgi:hypothetical protein
MNRKTISKKANSKGVVFALVSGDAGFEVWKLCENYNGKVRGGVQRTWRYAQKGMTDAAAFGLFNLWTSE